MAGLGRRTHYRKHLTDSVLYDLPEPKEDECIAKVVATRGGNQFDIVLAGTSDTTANTTTTGNESGLAILPTKFHKLVWVKRNDYVIVQTGTDTKKPDGDADDDDGECENSEDVGVKEDDKTGIRFIINHILYKDQVKHLVSKGIWPKNDPEFPVNASFTAGPTTADGNHDATNDDDDDGNVYGNTESEELDDGIVYTEYDMENDDDLFVNTNRIARLQIQDSDSEEDSSEEEED